MSTTVTNKKTSFDADTNPDIPVATRTIGGVEYQEIIKGIANVPHDYISLSYTGDNLTGVVYKIGGAGGTTQATLTLGYTGANLTSVTRT